MNYLAFSCLWCSTTLCFCYYVKIINLNGTIFYKLKAKLPVIVPWLLIFSNVISWIAGLPAYWDIYRQSQFSTDNSTNVPLTYQLNFKSRCSCIFHIYMGISSVAFIIIFFTAGSIIKSLLKHMAQIKKNNQGLGHARLSAHVSAAKTVTSLLLIYLILYGSLNAIFNEAKDIQSAIFIVSFLVASSFPTANAVILIFGNRKLSKRVKYILGKNSSTGNTSVSVST
ncbi:taste receptor type 2 member 40-like [Dendrobates tinctorius]|uniref:taste receptor type 2 member 40-like n=1 Tax=Dendrobates tinctorius TaxID=92724 RepID=UPI003CC9A7F0